MMLKMSKNKKTILIILSILIVLGLFLGVYYAIILSLLIKKRVIKLKPSV